MMDSTNTALVLIGYQNEYFRADGRLHWLVAEFLRNNAVLDRTITLLRSLPPEIPVIVSPTRFTKDYSELTDPSGTLKMIKDLKAFQWGSYGIELIDEIKAFGDRIDILDWKGGFNAFSFTDLDAVLRDKGIEHVVMAGAMAGLCIDATGRHAHSLGYSVSLLSDCTVASSKFEHNFYLESVCPSYAAVLDHQAFLETMQVHA